MRCSWCTYGASSSLPGPNAASGSAPLPSPPSPYCPAAVAAATVAVATVPEPLPQSLPNTSAVCAQVSPLAGTTGDGALPPAASSDGSSGEKSAEPSE
eukprot:357523-Chlamydomonas_euryale.AAC.14